MGCSCFIHSYFVWTLFLVVLLSFQFISCCLFGCLVSAVLPEFSCHPPCVLPHLFPALLSCVSCFILKFLFVLCLLSGFTLPLRNYLHVFHLCLILGPALLCSLHQTVPFPSCISCVSRFGVFLVFGLWTDFFGFQVSDCALSSLFAGFTDFPVPTSPCILMRELPSPCYKHLRTINLLHCCASRP